MNTKELIYQHFLLPFEKEGRRNIGVELEFPLLNLEKAPVQSNVTSGLMQHLCKCGFKPEECDRQGLPVFISNKQGDVLSFDNSFNNFEFSMEKDENLFAVSKRFYGYYNMVQEYLKEYNHTLCGMGINPYKKYITTNYVDIDVYSMVREYLSGFNSDTFHNYPDFPAYLSSIQTHLDVKLSDLPRAYTLYARLDFVRALLFSNSLPFEDEKGFEHTICFRDYLWERSGFGALADNTGKINDRFDTLDDILESFLRKSMFNRIRNGKYEHFAPQTIKEYFEKNENEKDIETYLSFKNVEITRRGTLEVRSDCAQPVRDAFAPAAFNLGILHSMKEAETKLDEFFVTNQIHKNNATLRDDVIYHNLLPAPEKSVIQLLSDLVTIAYDALKNRNKEEEHLLESLFERAKNVSCPALVTKHRLMEGESIENIIKDYSSILSVS